MPERGSLIYGGGGAWRMSPGWLVRWAEAARLDVEGTLFSRVKNLKEPVGGGGEAQVGCGGPRVGEWLPWFEFCLLAGWLVAFWPLGLVVVAAGGRTGRTR